MNHIIQQNIEQPSKEQWIFELADVITDFNVLLELLELDKSLVSSDMLKAKKQFALRVPRAFARRMEKGHIDDPLLKQVLCQDKELELTAGYSSDPLDEQQNKIPALLHKYHNRVLLMTKTNCAINCRYCFRRHFPYAQNQANKKVLLDALNYISNHKELNEVILSGGDPLMAKDHEMDWLLTELEKIPHIKRLRIHTRLAVVIPSRITDFLCARFKQSHLNIIVVTHINHPNEIDNSVILAMKKLKDYGVTLLNQSVLLKGINDDECVLVDLSEKLFDAGILPYYLHVLDKVQGSAHFYVDDDKARAIMRGIAKSTSGYLVPKLTREESGKENKTVLMY